MKLPVSLSILLILDCSIWFELESSKSNEQVQWFDLIGEIAYQNRNIVFSIFQASKAGLFGQKLGQNSKLRIIPKSISIHFRNICCVQIWSSSEKKDRELAETHTHEDGRFSTQVYQYTSIPLYSTTSLPTYYPDQQHTTPPLSSVLLPSALLCADKPPRLLEYH